MCLCINNNTYVLCICIDDHRYYLVRLPEAKQKQARCTMLYCNTIYYTLIYYNILYYTIIYHNMCIYIYIYYTILCYTVINYTNLYYAILYYRSWTAYRPCTSASTSSSPRARRRSYYTIRYYTILYYNHRCVYIYIYIYTHMCVMCIYIYIYTNMRVYVMYLSLSLYIYIYIYIYICICHVHEGAQRVAQERAALPRRPPSADIHICICRTYIDLTSMRNSCRSHIPASIDMHYPITSCAAMCDFVV